MATELLVDSFTTNSATLSWTPIPGNFVYQIFYTGPDGVEQTATSTTDPTTTITGLTPGSTYTFRVQSNTANGQGEVGTATTTTCNCIR